tara:strand:+ start:1101 stop:1424 length:324 start_codon:yes stop_codon:yes gene_type:complete
MKKFLSICALTLAVSGTFGCAGPSTQYQTGDNYTADEYGRFQGTVQTNAALSPEVQAFNRVQSRLGYNGATIGWDNRNCAQYLATAPDGRAYSEPLVNTNGQLICKS